jgi:hypothetical protein
MIKVVRKAATYKLLPASIELLKLLCEKHDRSQANMLEVLIKEAAKKEGLVK